MLKYSRIIFAPLLFLILCTACEETEYADVQFTSEYTVELSAETDTLQGSNKITNSYFAVFDSINPMEDENFKDYAGKIKEIYIKEFIGRITSINKSTKLKTAQILISADSNHVKWNLSNEMLMNGTVLELGNFEGQHEELVDILQKHQTFDVSMEGETAEENVSFNIELSLRADITAEPF